jgi:hypothetical protein
VLQRVIREREREGGGERECVELEEFCLVTSTTVYCQRSVCQRVQAMVSCCRYSSNARLDGKTAVVTGSNTGIGKFTALDFVKRGESILFCPCSTKRLQS